MPRNLGRTSSSTLALVALVEGQGEAVSAGYRQNEGAPFLASLESDIRRLQSFRKKRQAARHEDERNPTGRALLDLGRTHRFVYVESVAAESSSRVSRDLFWLVVSLLGSIALYLPWSVLVGDKTLEGFDFQMLHRQRLEFVQNALVATGSIPAWNPTELLGTPFASNVQSFPWIPTRLPLLLFDPAYAFAPAIGLAAGLSVMFTFLYARSLNLPAPEAALSGWTFAAAGFFASRVCAGHLPILEAYPTLPALLWLVERTVGTSRLRGRDVLALAFVSACTVLAGHPQIPTYSIVTAIVYALVRGAVSRRGGAIVVSLLLGVACTLVVWWPFADLLSRSTRMLPLDPASNDLPMPWGRLVALVFPDVNGFPAPVGGGVVAPFEGYPSTAYFWDTVVYVGVLPLLAALLLASLDFRQRRLPSGPWLFLALLGLTGAVFSLPLFEPVRHALPGTLLRSPARLWYLTTFALALAVGRALSRVRSDPQLLPSLARRKTLLVATVAVLHVMDLGSFSRLFVVPRVADIPQVQGLRELVLRSEHPHARIGVDRPWVGAAQSGRDDVGTFESVLLAGPYRALLAMSGAPPGFNEQLLSAGQHMSITALRASGVEFVLTEAYRPSLRLIADEGNYRIYAVPDPAPRASFVPRSSAVVLSEERIVTALRAAATTVPPPLMLEAEDYGEPSAQAAPGSLDVLQSVVFERQSADRIELRVEAPVAGFLKVIEAYDPGWSATVDAVAVPVLRADTYAMAVPVSPGAHLVTLEYATPRRREGLAGSVLFLVLVLVFARRMQLRGGAAAHRNAA